MAKKKKMYSVNNNKKDETLCGVISGHDIAKSRKGYSVVSFKTGRYMTEKDRPRKKVNRHTIKDFM